MKDEPSESKQLRVFAALPLPEQMRAVVLRGSDICRNNLQSVVRWVPPENLHLTLRFYGTITEAQLEVIHNTLSGRLAECTAPFLQLAGINAFPSLKRPSVFYVGVRIIQGDLQHLASICEKAALHAGLPEEKKQFKAHITIGRIKRNAVAPCAEEVLSEPGGEVLSGQEFRADNVVLFNSELSSRGPLYSAFRNYRLKS